MKQVAGLISTYSSDEFGICSALYELGGMVVMHDASGCNSTYTTHDEPRWYDMDSMIYISAISEMEAIMGDDEKLIRDITETAQELNPAFVAVTGAPIPYMIGTDLPAIAAVVEQETKIPSFGFAANGMHDYLSGISMALEAVVNRFCIRDIPKTERLSVNIIGATPLDFSLNGSIDSMIQWLQEQDMEPGACLCMGTTLEEIKRAGQAHVNLAVSYGGLAAARTLNRIFGTPYVIGVPVGKTFAAHLADQIRQTAADQKNRISYQEAIFPNRTSGSQTLAVIGESIYSASLAAAIGQETGIPVHVLCPLDTERALLRECDLQTPEEDDLIRHLPQYTGLIADPLYGQLWEDRRNFYPLPHEAFSGRIYDAANPNLINKSLKKGGFQTPCLN